MNEVGIIVKQHKKVFVAAAGGNYEVAGLVCVDLARDWNARRIDVFGLW